MGFLVVSGLFLDPLYWVWELSDDDWGPLLCGADSLQYPDGLQVCSKTATCDNILRPQPGALIASQSQVPGASSGHALRSPQGGLGWKGGPDSCLRLGQQLADLKSNLESLWNLRGQMLLSSDICSDKNLCHAFAFTMLQDTTQTGLQAMPA